jgi:hypothetical protein
VSCPLPTGNEDADCDLITSSSRVGDEIATSLQKHFEMSRGHDVDEPDDLIGRSYNLSEPLIPRSRRSVTPPWRCGVSNHPWEGKMRKIEILLAASAALVLAGAFAFTAECNDGGRSLGAA